MKSGQIKVTARSFEWLATSTTELRFPAPLADRAPDPSGFEFWWKMMEFVFALPAPGTFPAFERQPKKSQREILDRYVSACEELAESQVLSGQDGMTVHVPDGPEDDELVETTFSSKELTRGFAVLFRQLHTSEKSDPARFLRVDEILKQCNDRAGDAYVDERRRQLASWRKARGSLLAENLKGQGWSEASRPRPYALGDSWRGTDIPSDAHQHVSIWRSDPLGASTLSNRGCRRRLF